MKMNMGYGKEIPSVIEHIKIWFLQKGSNEDIAQSFFKFYEKKGGQTQRVNKSAIGKQELGSGFGCSS